MEVSSSITQCRIFSFPKKTSFPLLNLPIYPCCVQKIASSQLTFANDISSCVRALRKCVELQVDKS